MGHTARDCDGVDRGDSKTFTIGAAFGGFFRVNSPLALVFSGCVSACFPFSGFVVVSGCGWKWVGKA